MDAARSIANDNSGAYTVIMIRTQISLSRDDYEAAKAEAARLGISLAEFVRRALRSALPADTTKPWMHYAGMVESGDPASSLSIDDVVYGHKG
jgi:tRNA(Met) C34 N-acetyltransferase TmcA